MAIEKMKKLRLIAIRSQKEEILRELMLMGCVEVTEPDELLSDPDVASLTGRETAELDKLRSDYAVLSRALEVINQYAPSKSKLFDLRPELTQSGLLDEKNAAERLELAKNLELLDNRVRRHITEENNERSLIESLIPWTDLPLPLNSEGTRSSAVLLGTIPTATDFDSLCRALNDSAPESEAFSVSVGSELRYITVVFLRKVHQAVADTLRRYNFSLSPLKGMRGTARDNISKCEKRIAVLTSERNELISQIMKSAKSRDELRLCYDHTGTKIARAEAAENLIGTKSTILLTGWVTAVSEPELATRLSRYACAWEFEDPGPEENESIPIKLKNNPLTRPLMMVTEMYSLPAYRGVDPNPLMAPFFIFFYGMMMADMGYGLLMILAGILVRAKAKPRGTMKHLLELMTLCGITTFIMGALTGGFFGDAPLQVARIFNPDTTWQGLPALFSPLDDALMVLIGSLALGLMQIFTGMAISFVKQVRRGEALAAVFNEGAWFLVFALFGVAAITGAWGNCLLAILVLLVLTQGYGKKGVVGKIMGVFGSLYSNVTGYFSDILSYSRLMALMLAGAVIAQVFNTLGAITGNIIAFLIISLIGNALNFALNLLGCFVHDLRLQCLEYFGRFYEDGGKPFKPLTIKTIYHDIVKD